MNDKEKIYEDTMETIRTYNLSTEEYDEIGDVIFTIINRSFELAEFKAKNKITD